MSLIHSENKRPYGLLAEFATPRQLVQAAERAHQDGYTLDAFSPFPIEGLSEAIGFPKSRLPVLVFCGAVLGGLSGFALEYYCSVIAYPINVGGRPLNSWPSFIPIAFETTILCAAFTAVLGMLFLNGLPMPYHPVFNVARFAAASRDGYFLLVKSAGPSFEAKRASDLLRELGASEVSEVTP
jgi:hypothetical protein